MLFGRPPQVTTLERKQLDSDDMLQRMQLIESRLGQTTSRLSPFGQADLLQRLEAVEQTAAHCEEEAKQLKFKAVEVKQTA